MNPLKSNLAKLVVVALLVCGPQKAQAADQGYLGFVFTVDAESFSFNPTLRLVAVDRVIPGSPAEKAGLTKGDQVTEIEGHTVTGAKANDLKQYLSINVGETVHLKVKDASGQTKSLTLTAVSKP